MFTQFLGTAATVYGVLAALKTLLQTRQMLAHRTSREVSARFFASYTGGYAIWLTYGLSTGSLPLIVVDTVGLLCGGLTLAVALSLRGPHRARSTVMQEQSRRRQTGPTASCPGLLPGFPEASVPGARIHLDYAASFQPDQKSPARSAPL